jgi:hypothetical protein
MNAIATTPAMDAASTGTVIASATTDGMIRIAMMMIGTATTTSGLRALNSSGWFANRFARCSTVRSLSE